MQIDRDFGMICDFIKQLIVCKGIQIAREVGQKS